MADSRDNTPGKAGSPPDDGKTVFKPSSSAAGQSRGPAGKKTPSDPEAGPKTQFRPSKHRPDSPASARGRSPEKTSPEKKAVKASIAKVREAAKAKGVPEVNAALTHIRQSIRDQDSSAGFVKAKQAANAALAADKIILNKRFVLEQTLGAGGMGTVYRARDLRKVEANDLKPDVAVKVLNDDFKNHPDAFVTLQREASRSHTLSHPNIVTVHDFDRDGDVIYMTMELLEGMGLDIVLRQHQGTGLAMDEAFAIIRDFSEALQHAHSKDIVHSDLKPGNIFVTDEGAKVLDFGIARVANATHDDFDAGSLGALTPAYASLEMIENAPPDARDDVYAAALIAYELLTGKHPYDRASADKVLERGMKPPRIAKLNNRQWKALESGLKIRREERTQSITDFLAALTTKKKFPVFKVASAVLVVALSSLAYVFFSGSHELNDVIEQSYQKAEQCFAQQQYTCAIESSRAVLELSPEHSQAQNLFERARASLTLKNIATLMTKGERCLDDQQDSACAKAALVKLTELAPEAKEVALLNNKITAFDTQQALAQQLAEGASCFAAEDYQCAVKFANSALALDGASTEAMELKQAAQTQIANLTSQRQQQNQRFETALASARSCMAKNDHRCALKFAKQALAIKPADGQASALQQQALYAQQRQQENRNKADRLVTKAKQCLAKKNYSCATANAESALEFVPNYRPAVELQTKAKQELEQLKNSISIQ